MIKSDILFEYEILSLQWVIVSIMFFMRKIICIMTGIYINRI